MGKESAREFVRGLVFSSQRVEHCRIGGDHWLEMEIIAIKSWLLRHTHLTKGHCSVAVPANKKTTNHRDAV